MPPEDCETQVGKKQKVCYVDENKNDADTKKASSLLEIICSNDDDIRNLSLDEYCCGCNRENLLKECEALDTFRRSSTNLYETVRALFFLYAIYRFHLPTHNDNDNDVKRSKAAATDEIIPYVGYQALLDRKFEEAIDCFLQHEQQFAIESALAKAYYQLGFQTLANQVRRSVQSHPGNSWMFAPLSDVKNHPLTWVLPPQQTLKESTPVRMDVSHCGWSDIFFLGMDYPQGARVLNISIDLAVNGSPKSPITSILRTSTRNPGTITLTSVDLNATAVLHTVGDVFQFGSDYLGLLRAGIVASGLIPSSYEKHPNTPLSIVLESLLQKNEHFKDDNSRNVGLELITQVHDIPKGSRLAVSTNLLGSIIAICMRATGQTSTLEGMLAEEERRLVAARAILGEWLGGSGGGWQDSGGIWPGIKLIEGIPPTPKDPEYQLSRGRLLPSHTLLPASDELVQKLQQSLILVHGGMAQNVGPVLEMVTEKYLLRSSVEWKARQEALQIFDEILLAMMMNKNENDKDQKVDMKRLANLTTKNFFRPLQSIIPWASNCYTETLIERIRNALEDELLGFWMLGGCSGGGMGFIVTPTAKTSSLQIIQNIMLQTKREMEHSLPFAMDPVVYDFSINHSGTVSTILKDDEDRNNHSTTINTTTSTTSTNNDKDSQSPSEQQDLESLLKQIGFDKNHHELIRQQMLQGIIGLEQNRLPQSTTKLENVQPDDVVFSDNITHNPTMVERGYQELKKGTVGVVTLAAGVGSRWTQGAGVVKALHPFCKFQTKFRNFLQVHLAKSKYMSRNQPYPILHAITTSYMTHDPIQSFLKQQQQQNASEQEPCTPIYVSKGTNVGLRFIPTIRDLKFAWEETQHQKLDSQAQKVQESLQAALLSWVKENGEASDYQQPVPSQCLHPIGHYYEIPNLILNGTLQQMLTDRPQLQYLMLHNIDTVGANVDAGLLGYFATSDKALSFEVMDRGIEDTGGGLAKVNGKVRLVEGLAFPNEKDEWKCSYYNSMTTWIHIDKLLGIYDLTRDDLTNTMKVQEALARISEKLPIYVTLKDVKTRWGNGQEDVHPVAQYEQLWGDMSSIIPEQCDFVVVPRRRGQQLKDPAQLDGWLREGSASYVETFCSF